MQNKRLIYFVFAVGFCMLICHYVHSADNSASKEPKCKSLFTFGYGYRQFFHLSPNSIHQANGDLLSMKFKVKARQDAHILLSPSPSPEEIDDVYEIVIGAGRNSFSDIRRKRRSATKSSAYTKDVLSGTEMREFWIKIDSEGLLQVGNSSNDLPFMEWQDPNPLHIEYFSFCTWSGVAGKWLYDCSVADKTESIAVMPIMTATDMLRQALLRNYDVYSSPVTNNSTLIQIYVQIQASYVQLDVKKSIMTVGSEFTLVWFDDKMIWDPENFNNLSTLNLIHHEIWQPQLVHFNAVGKGVSPLGEAGMQVTADGKVRWRPRSQIQSRCQMDLQHWPWDTQTCKVQLGFWNQLDMLQLILLENGTKLEMQKTASEWVVQKLEAESVIIEKPWLIDSTAFSSDDLSDDIDNPTSAALVFTFTLRRSNAGYFYILVIPLSVIVVMSLISFWMDPLGKEKLGTHCLLLVLLCGFLLSLDHSLPLSGDHSPYLFTVYSWVLLVEGCATIMTVIITSLVRTSHHRPPPQLICRILTSEFIVSLFCLPKPKPEGRDYGQISETGETSDYFSLVKNSQECDSVANIFWGLVAAFCDRVAFFTAVIAYTVIFVC